MKQRLKLNSFFAGIGGFDLGFERSGIEIAFHCEINPFSRSVLKRHWPKAKVQTDITAINLDQLPTAQIWAGGFPCQDVSVARGSMGRAGLHGKRSGLFHIFSDLISEKLPEVVLLENVTGLLNSHDGLDFELILMRLTELGYGVAWRVLNSRYFGAPQSRSRVFICAWLGSPERAVRALYEDVPSEFPPSERAGFLASCTASKSGAIVPEVAYCLAATSGRHTGTDWSRSYVSYQKRVRRLTPTECEGLQGFPKGWSIPEDALKVASIDLDSLRYEALGNAVCVPVIEWIASRIKEEWKLTPSESIGSIDLLTPFPTLKPKSVLTLGEVSAARGKFKWSSGGISWGGKCLLSGVSPSPTKPVAKLFADVLEHESISERHYLSPNAAEGILRRVRSQKRTLFGPLEVALEQLAGSASLKEETTETWPIDPINEGEFLLRA
jgi:DNA (cytosine-5)-methyltransferase 1